MSIDAAARELVLIVTANGRTCAIALEHVSEIMRPLPVRSLAGLPAFVQGMSVVRGMPTPVIDVCRLLGDAADSRRTRWVALTLEGRSVVLSVDGVLGAKRLAEEEGMELPPLLRDVPGEYLDRLDVLDAELLVILRAGRLVPDAVWAQLAPDLERLE